MLAGTAIFFISAAGVFVVLIGIMVWLRFQTRIMFNKEGQAVPAAGRLSR